MAIDPVCKTEVNDKKAPSADYKGKKYYFCCPSCQWAFETKPQEFIKEE